MGRLENKVALITGANSGIGEAVAKLFAQEGAAVVMTARRESELKRVADEITAAGGTCMYVTGDVTVTADVDNVVDTAVKTYGHVDILVNNAGIPDGHKTTIDMTDEFWNQIINVDLTGVMRYCRACLRYMQPANSGSIVNISSIGGVYHCAGAAYSSAKAAVISLTKNLARQYFGTGIRINSVSPGATDTPLFSSKTITESEQGKEGGGAPPMRPNDPGMLSPLQQAYAVLFFACDESSGINGQNIVVDYGGML